MKLPVVVLGGGPAASACALSLRQLDPSIPVVIARPADGTGWQPGESLSPAARQIFDSLGCWERFRSEDFLESHGVRTAWDSEVASARDYLASAHGSGWHLVRRRFDRMLMECAVESGAEVMDGARFLDATRSVDGHWNLRLQNSSVEASFVVDATGRNAVFATAAGARRQSHDSLTAAFRLFRVTRPLPVETLVEAREHGWWYAVPVPGERVAAGWMTDPDLLRGDGLHEDAAWLEHLRASRHVAQLLEGAEPLSGVEVRSAGSFCLDTFTGSGWLAAGDSASTYDPLSGQGILKALRFGRIASYALFDSLRGRAGALELYAKLVRQDYASYLEQKTEYYGRVKRWPHSMFWRRRQG